MKPEARASSVWPSLVVAMIFVMAAFGQCGSDGHRSSEDVCGNQMRPVTVGGSMVVGCRR